MQKKYLCNIFIFFFLINYQTVNASSDTLLINQLIKSIAADQVKKYDGDFYEGMFYNYRECGAWPKNRQADRNIFFTAITCFTLKNMLPYLNYSNKVIIQSIIQNATKAYPYFLNTKPNGFYEFWPTDKTFMPHAVVMKYTKPLFGQGEDVDDCVMVLMTSNHPDSIHQNFKKRMIHAANLSVKKIDNTFDEYREFPAYSTYLGTKMKTDFDFCVQCNVIYYCHQQKLPFVKQDTATINLLAAVLKNRDYINHPTYVSPWYGNPAVLIYHVSRLMGAFKIPELEVYKEQLIEDANYLLTQPSNIMDKIILSTSLLRLGSIPKKEISFKDIAAFEKTNEKDFYFFQARGAAFMSNFMKKIFSNQGAAFYFNFFCETYNKALLLEYLIERNKARN